MADLPELSIEEGVIIEILRKYPGLTIQEILQKFSEVNRVHNYYLIQRMKLEGKILCHPVYMKYSNIPERR